MTQKIEITKYVATEMGLAVDGKLIKKLVNDWWQNPMNKEVGGLKLTEQGHICLKKVKFKEYKIKVETQCNRLTNQQIILLDRFIDCPWFLTNKEVIVYGERMAVQLVLFSGNILKFASARAEKIGAT